MGLGPQSKITSMPGIRSKNYKYNEDYHRAQGSLSYLVLSLLLLLILLLLLLLLLLQLLLLLLVLLKFQVNLAHHKHLHSLAEQA